MSSTSTSTLSENIGTSHVIKNLLGFDWEDLRYFIVFSKIKSLNAAAKALGVEHATVSRRIASLERSLQVKLVDRRKRSYDLTADGQRLATIGIRMEEEANAVGRLAVSAQVDIAGEVTVSAPPSLSAQKLAPYLGDLRNSYPGIVLRFVDESSYQTLCSCQSDLCIRFTKPSKGGVVARRIGTVRFSFYATKRYLTGREVTDYEYISYDDDLDMQDQEAWLNEIIGSRKYILKAKTIDIQVKAAQAGVGIALLPEFATRESASLIELSASPSIEVDVWLGVHEDLRGAPAIQATMSFIEECFAQSTGYPQPTSQKSDYRMHARC